MGQLYVYKRNGKMKSNDWKNINLGTTFNGIRHTMIKRILSPYGRYRRFLTKSQWWPESKLRQYQFRQLCNIIHYAYYHVPYYRRMFDKSGLKPEDIRSLKDINKIPILEKEDIRLFHKEMVAKTKFIPILYKCNTSGSTGTPITLYRNLHNVGFEHALLMRQFAWGGIKAYERTASLKGEIITNNKLDKEKFWEFSSAENRLIMSSYHISKDTVEKYVSALKRYKPVAIDGYPSSIYSLAKLMLARNIRIPLKAVFTSSETLLTSQKQVIEYVFSCRAIDYYGMAERVAAIHTCEHGNYHIVPEYGYVELLNCEDENDEYYEIIGTSLTNFAMPLIRYRTGDIVKIHKQPVFCPCCRNYPVVEKIIGRLDDYIVTPSGKLVGRLDHIFKGISNVVQAQLFQPDLNRIVLRIVPDKYYQEQDGEQILNNLQRRLGEKMLFEIERMTDIPRGGRGKFKSVVSNVNLDSKAVERQAV